MKLRTVLIPAVTIAAAFVFGTVQSARAAGGVYVEHGWPNGSSWCLDNINDNPNNGNQQQIWHCNGDFAQTWNVGSAYTINGITGYPLHDDYVGGGCLDIPNDTTHDGTRTQIWTCKGNANQLWFNDADDQPGEWENYNGMCLDLRNDVTANGQPIQVWHCNGGPAQAWTFN